MNHINLDENDIKNLISDAHWDKVGIKPTNMEAQVIDEATEATEAPVEGSEEVLEEDEELTLEDLEALLSVFPDNVLEEHAVSMAEVLNEAFEESQGDLVEEEYEEEDEDEALVGELVDSIVNNTLEDLAAEEE